MNLSLISFSSVPSCGRGGWASNFLGAWHLATVKPRQNYILPAIQRTVSTWCLQYLHQISKVSLIYLWRYLCHWNTDTGTLNIHFLTSIISIGLVYTVQYWENYNLFHLLGLQYTRNLNIYYSDAVVKTRIWQNTLSTIPEITEANL